MARPFIVVSDGFDSELFKELVACPQLEVHPQAKLTAEQLKELLPKVEGLIIRSATKVDANLLSAAPKLKLVIRAGEGTDNIDKKACASKGVKVENTPGANSNSAAEQAIALLFAVLRKTAQADASTKAGKWEKSKFTGQELWQRKVGIVGMGKIGQIFAKRIAGFEPQISYWDPFVTLEQYTKVENLADLFAQSDIISIHLPLKEQTRNLITKKELSQLPPHGILINAARGGIVNEEDLLSILKEKKIWGAGVDVFKSEPLPADSPFLGLDNCVCTPHLGASTVQAQVRVGQMAVQQIKAFFLENKLLNEVKA
jgi:D-3-phosphoglycerate dehydrogenase